MLTSGPKVTKVHPPYRGGTMDTRICVHSSGNQIQPSSVAVSIPQLRKLSADRESIRVLALLVRLFCGIVTLDLPITHNDSRYLIATEHNYSEIMGAGFTLLFIDKIKKKHIFNHVHVGDDRSRDEGECVLGSG